MNEIFANTSNLNNPLLNVTLSFNNLDNTKPIVNVPASTSNFQSIYLKKEYLNILFQYILNIFIIK